LGFGAYCATHSVDFPVYYRVAVQIAHGDYEIYPTAINAAGAVPPHGFRYAPAIAFLFVPFGWLPLGVAAFVFYTVKAAAVVYVAAVVARQAGSATPVRTLMWRRCCCRPAMSSKNSATVTSMSSASP
jgi:hypothetical protein